MGLLPLTAIRFDGDFRIGQRDAEPFLHGLHHGFRHVAHLIELEETGAGGAHAGLIFRFIFVRVTHGCILSVEVRSGVPEPMKKPGWFRASTFSGCHGFRNGSFPSFV